MFLLLYLHYLIMFSQSKNQKIAKESKHCKISLIKTRAARVTSSLKLKKMLSKIRCSSIVHTGP